MARLPTSAPPTLPPLNADEFHVDLEVITPMFGGSAAARTVNSDHPVRAASVRGQLRFWWRATAGAAFKTHQELLDAESRIWGCMATPGKEKKGKDGKTVDPVDVGRVSVSVETLGAGKVGSADQFPQKMLMSYAIFPFQANNQQSAAEYVDGVRFRLILRGLGSDRAAVIQALAAWIQFGGVGARTRRGCGSVRVVGGDALPVVSVGAARSGQAWSLRPRVVLFGAPKPSAFAAWQAALVVYRDFRQLPGFARNEGSRERPGRSRFPEADTLRRALRTHAPEHRPLIDVDGFPRADLGLPIIFQFKDRRSGDPAPQTLEGATEGLLRFASPVITKVVERDGEFVPMLALLDAPHVWEGKAGVRLKGRRELIPREQLQLPEGDRKQIRPLAGRPVREALVEFARTQGFREAK